MFSNFSPCRHCRRIPFLGDDGDHGRDRPGAVIRPTLVLLFHQRLPRSCIFDAVHQHCFFTQETSHQTGDFLFPARGLGIHCETIMAEKHTVTSYPLPSSISISEERESWEPVLHEGRGAGGGRGQPCIRPAPPKFELTNQR